MFDTIPRATGSKLWTHQRGALNFAIDHLNKFDSTCLIRMPTGTGKTGVIACLTRLSNKGSSLVLTPWANLRQQMIDDLNGDFWAKIGVAPAKREVVSMFPTTAKAIIAMPDPKVIVATFATLNDLRLNHPDTYKKLAANISLVVVDEGHYEPAVEWGKSVKGLKVRTVLLTATPYRNDLKLFRITDSTRSTHHFTHKQAVENKIIRELTFDELFSPTDIPSLTAAFADKWDKAKKANKLPSQDPRAIICCSDSTDIEETVHHLRRAGMKRVIGVHEGFEKSKDPHLKKEVPDSQKTNWEIWVHQHKLTEGLDDHRFCCVALFTRIRNDRKLIQQIGRVLRRDKTDHDVPAILYAPKDFAADAEWNAYLEFEPVIKLLEPQHFRDVVDTLLGVQPKVEYFDGRFRRRFSPVDLSHKSQVIIPPSVLVRATGKDFSLDEYIQDCTDTLNTEDAVILGPEINAPCQKAATFALWVYASVRNSRFLQTTSLYEVKLETHCVVVADGFVFTSDSSGNFPVECLEEHTTPVSAQQLARFLDKSFRPTHVSVASSIPYETVVRGADQHGHNLLSVPTSLTDRVQICRSAKGSSKKLGRRYVGLNNGRVRKEATEEERRSFELTTFVSWAQGVAKILNSKVDGSSLFQRYMPTCAPPSNLIPKNICLDLLRHDLNLTLADGTECTLRSSCSDIKVTSKPSGDIFTCRFALQGTGTAGKSLELRIEFQAAKQRFWFNKVQGAAVQVSLDGDDESSTKSLAEFLNQKQDIILIGLEGGKVVYQGRNFYEIDYSYAEQVLLALIERPANAPKCGTEKGTKKQQAAAKRTKAKVFPDGSLFRATAERAIGLPFSDDLLICADLGTECADFVAANFKNSQMALIHAKTGTGTAISASTFHDVVAQALKNLTYLTRNADAPKGVGSWRRDAKWNKTGVSRLLCRGRNLPAGIALWEKMKAEIIGSSDPRLFVVLLTAGCCDRNELEKAVKDPAKRTHEVAQLFHLLDGLNGYARQLGARLIIRDLPYQP
jgi:superfamily II DNA or RNA helicase